MEVVSLIVSILGLAGTMFAIGYSIGRDNGENHKTQK